MPPPPDCVVHATCVCAIVGSLSLTLVFMMTGGSHLELLGMAMGISFATACCIGASALQRGDAGDAKVPICVTV